MNDEETIIIALIVIDVFIIVLTLAGNILTICAIAKSKRLSELLSNRYILSLAVSDLLVGLTLPYHLVFAIGDRMRANKDNCILRFVLVILACSSSIYNLLVIAADRYTAIMYPFFYNRNITSKVSWMIISSGWLVSITVATMPTYWNDYVPGQCTQDKFLPTTYVNFIITPMFLSIWLVMSLLYIRIWREAVSHAKRLRDVHNLAIPKKRLKESKSMQMVLLILGCFSLCWFPYFFVITYTRMIGTSWPTYYETAFTLAVSSSCMNPLIYAWKSKNYRDAFCCLLRCQSIKSLDRQRRRYVTDHVRRMPTIQETFVLTPTPKALVN